jgi:hypothetical protein
MEVRERVSRDEETGVQVLVVGPTVHTRAFKEKERWHESVEFFGWRRCSG